MYLAFYWAPSPSQLRICVWGNRCVGVCVPVCVPVWVCICVYLVIQASVTYIIASCIVTSDGSHKRICSW